MRLLRLLFILSSAVWASSSAAQAVSNSVNIQFNFADFQQIPANVSQVKFTPIPTNGAVNGFLLHQEFPNFTRATAPSLTNGTLTISNVLKGVVYETTFTARGREQTYYINADTNAADGATIGAWTNVVAPTNLFGLFLSYLPNVPGSQVGYVPIATDTLGHYAWGPQTGGGGGGGNVTGPGSSTAHHIAAFANTSGQLLEDAGYLSSAVLPWANWTTNAFDTSAFKPTSFFDLAGAGTTAATAATNALVTLLTNNFNTETQVVGTLQTAFASSIAKTDANSNLVAAISGTDYDGPGAGIASAAAATNGIGRSSQLSAFAPTNQFVGESKFEDVTNAFSISAFGNASGLSSGAVASARMGTNDSSASDGWVLSRTSPNSKWIAFPDVGNYPVAAMVGSGPHLIWTGTNDANGSPVFTNGTIASSLNNSMHTLNYSQGTNAIVDASLGRKFELLVTTNTTLIFSNVSDGVEGHVYLKQDANGAHSLFQVLNTVGTNQNPSTLPITITTNANALTRLDFESSYFGTNLAIVTWTNWAPVASSGGGGYSASVLADSPVGYYRLNESSGSTFADSSGNSRNLTLASGSPTYGVTGATTDGDKAITCSGATTVINGQTTPFVPGSTDFTLECWVKSTTVGTKVAVGKVDSLFAGDSYWIGFSSGNITFAANSVLVSASGGNDGNWHHVVGTKTASTVTLYVDGASVATGGAAGSCSPTGNFTIGRFGDGTTSGFEYPDSVDEVAFYTSALSSGRVSAHYSAR